MTKGKGSYSKVSASKSSRRKPSAKTQTVKKRKTSLQRYFEVFFDEKGIPYVSWEITDKYGLTHFIDSETVINFIINSMTPVEQMAIKNKIIQIDFHNAPMIPFLKYIAEGIVNNYQGLLRSE